VREHEDPLLSKNAFMLCIIFVSLKTYLATKIMTLRTMES